MDTRDRLSRYDRFMATARHPEYVSDYNAILELDEQNLEKKIHAKIYELCNKWNLPYSIEPFQDGKKMQEELWESPAVMVVRRSAGPMGNRLSRGENVLSHNFLAEQIEREKDYDRFEEYFYLNLRIDATRNIKKEIWPELKRIIQEKLSGAEGKSGRKPTEDIWAAYDKYGKDKVSRSKLAKRMTGITGKVRHDPEYKKKWNKIDRAVKRADSIIKSIVPNP